MKNKILYSLLILYSCAESDDVQSKRVDVATSDIDLIKRSLTSHSGSFNKTLQDSIFQIYPDLNNITFEQLNDTAAEITLVQTSSNSSNLLNLEYVAVDINGEMFEALQYTSLPVYDGYNELITADFIYFNLDGTFLDAYRMENQQITHRLNYGITTNQAGFNFVSLITALFQSPSDCDEDLNPNSAFCEDDLEAVLIIGDPPLVEHPVYYAGYFNQPTETLDANPNGGGRMVICPEGEVASSDGLNCHKIPCVNVVTGNGDPLDNMEVLGTPKNGVPGGRYGNGRGRFHDGVDLSAPFGTPVFASHNGVVASYPYRNNWSMEEHGVTRGEGAGNRIYLNFILGSDNLQFGYWHLGEVLVQPGQQVYQGQLIGYTGNTGNVSNPGSAGSHLHLRARLNGVETDLEPYFATELNAQGQPVNPNCN
ncbi:MAG: hypothetical protein ACI9YE_003633 [Psychroserpens sp.]|jgi:hypothetical protein